MVSIPEKDWGIDSENFNFVTLNTEFEDPTQLQLIGAEIEFLSVKRTTKTPIYFLPEKKALQDF